VIAPLHVGDHALEAVGTADDVTAVVDVAEVDAVLAAAEQDRVAVLLLQLGERRLDVEAVVLASEFSMWK
jgi:hypothetical protein